MTANQRFAVAQRALETACLLTRDLRPCDVTQKERLDRKVTATLRVLHPDDSTLVEHMTFRQWRKMWGDGR